MTSTLLIISQIVTTHKTKRTRTKPSVDDPTWSEWQLIGQCSRTCGTGVQTQIRNCTRGDCPKEEMETEELTCKLEDCPGQS